jgi:hypothetical protein
MSELMNQNDQPNFNREHFAKTFTNLITNAREQGTPPPTADHAIKGLEAIRDLYLKHPATETSAKLAVDLAEVLFFAYGEFASSYLAAEAAASALDQQ